MDFERRDIHVYLSRGIIPIMDRLEELSNTLSNITMYDIRNMYNQVRCRFSLPYICLADFHITRRLGFPLTLLPWDECCVMQAKNAVLNISEMEAKVREATNDEPWYEFDSRRKWWNDLIFAGVRVRL